MHGVGVGVRRAEAAGKDTEDDDAMSGGEPALDRQCKRKRGVIAVRRKDEDVQTDS